MNTTTELEQEIRKQLGNLHRTISAQREDKTDTREVEQTLDYFLIDWCNRLIIEEHAELRGSRHGIEMAQARDTDHDTAASVGEKSEVAIKDRYSELRLGMINAVQEIENGREPRFLVRESFAELVRRNQRGPDLKP